MSGQLERCEREWHELEGEFQELQGSLFSAFGALLQADFGVVDGICQF